MRNTEHRFLEMSWLALTPSPRQSAFPPHTRGHTHTPVAGGLGLARTFARCLPRSQAPGKQGGGSSAAPASAPSSAERGRIPPPPAQLPP